VTVQTDTGSQQFSWTTIVEQGEKTGAVGDQPGDAGSITTDGTNARKRQQRGCARSF
jgi:hypothetical protein